MEDEELLPEEDDTEALLKEYDNIERGKAEDITAMQAVICILLAAVFLGINFTYPEKAESLLNYFKTLTESQEELFRNPIDWIIEYWSALK